MVGIVIVTHSRLLAEGIADEIKIMASDCPVALAGGTADGGYGTSYEKIKAAVDAVHGADGVIVLTDMGSSAMTAEMLLEEPGYEDVLISDAPLVEGALAASLASVCGDDLETVFRRAAETKSDK